MINKKYRPVKLWCLLLLCEIGGLAIACLPLGTLRSAIAGLCCVVLFLCLILSLTYYIEVKEDRLIVRYSTSSNYNRKYYSMFKTHTFMFNEIRNLDVHDYGKHKSVEIFLKTGDTVFLKAGGFTNCDYAEVKKLIFDIKKKIYESQCGADA